MNIAISTRHRKPAARNSSEEGYILVAVMFMLAILIIALSVAAPKIAKEIQRDREIETMHRGKQYARGVKLYYKKFGAYPPSVDALVKTNEIRFLRKKYIDPTTGKEDWKAIHLGRTRLRRPWASLASAALQRRHGRRSVRKRAAQLYFFFVIEQFWVFFQLFIREFRIQFRIQLRLLLAHNRADGRLPSHCRRRFQFRLDHRPQCLERQHRP